MTKEQLSRVQDFVRQTFPNWRELFTEVGGNIDQKIGVGFVVDGWSQPVLMCANVEKPLAFLSDPRLKSMPEIWRDGVREFIERAVNLSAPGLLRVVLVHAKREEPFMICFKLDLGNGCVS